MRKRITSLLLTLAMLLSLRAHHGRDGERGRG